MELRHEGRTIAEIGTLTGIADKTIRKYLKMPTEDIPGRRIDSREKEHLEAMKKLAELVNLARELKRQGHSVRAIARKTGIDSAAVRKYLEPSFVAVNGQYGKHREGKLAPYRDIVLQMKSDGKNMRRFTTRYKPADMPAAMPRCGHLLPRNGALEMKSAPNMETPLLSLSTKNDS
jgi:predicted transcriptional regulator